MTGTDNGVCSNCGGMTLMDKMTSAFKRTLRHAVERNSSIIVSYREPCKAKLLGMVRETRKLIESQGDHMLLLDNDAYQICSTAKVTEKVSGDIAEVGVYQGGSALLLCKVKGGRTLHLFDRFEEGLPDTEDFGLSGGEYAASFDKVKQMLKGFKGVMFHRGLFPEETGKDVAHRKFAFVHIDVDIYTSTLNSLRFFYPRMSVGGIIISHDYPMLAGVKRAFDEFFEDKPEAVIELSGNQCMVVKVKA